MRRKNRAQLPLTSSDESDSDDTNSTTSNGPSPKRKRGRPPGTGTKNKKKQRIQDDSDDDASPQPSTSQNGHSVHNTSDSESDSGSESPDSDYEHVIDRSLKKKKTEKKRGCPPKAQANQKKPHNNVNSSKTSQKHSLNTSSKKNSKMSTSSTAIFDPKLVEYLAQKCVYFLLIEDQKKYAIRKKAIVTHVFKDDNYSAKLYVAMMHEANEILKKTYGMELFDLENQKDSYLIVNVLRRELGIHDYFELSPKKHQQQGLILFLVTVIYMNKNTITEDDLIKCLKPLGIDLTSKRLHPVFGDVKKYITTELVKQMYLNYECISKEPPRYEFTWGLRTKQEFGKMDLLQFACQIIDGTSPEDWKIQYKDAEKSTKGGDAD